MSDIEEEMLTALFRKLSLAYGQSVIICLPLVVYLCLAFCIYYLNFIFLKFFFPFWGQNIATNIQLLFAKLHDCNFQFQSIQTFYKGKRKFAVRSSSTYTIRRT